MCGIVGAVAERNIVPVLIEGLKRLEYRGYDSAGLAIFDQSTKQLKRCRRVGKVNELQKALDHDSSFISRIGIAHTRWATHGIPSELNAHPHFSHNEIAVVHNGIIENHDELRRMLQTKGYIFESETDTEVIAHLLHFCSKQTDYLVDAVKLAIKQLEGAYGLASVNVKQPDRLVVARSGSPLVIGLGLGENFIASDQLALRQVTDRFIYLEEGDIAEIEQKKINIWDKNNQLVTRGIVQSTEKIESINKGKYRHFMLKEIYEQPEAIKKTLENRLGLTESVFKQIENIQIVACGTSYHAGMVARYWFESLANIPCQVEVASEFRSRKVATQKNTLFVSISQSGETADTLAALRDIKNKPYLASLAICNVGTSSLVRESDLTLLTLAGPEIGVASTKAFTT
ncbi:UNVERIFIED_CONTAM: hypothetical protein GTU68_008218, partial [Idotea baltica]|nr:hypothetical protein [Idotea baltica]